MTGVLLLGGLTCGTVVTVKRRLSHPELSGEAEPEPGRNPSLAEQISRLIEEEELYKRKDRGLPMWLQPWPPTRLT